MARRDDRGGAEADTQVARPSSAAPNDDSLPDLPARFSVTRTIARGGMGVVLEAHDRMLGRNVAVKILAGDRRGDRAFRARFLREARAAATLRHPGIVTVHDIDGEGNFIVMELVEGGSLDRRLASSRRLPVDDVRAIGLAVLEALGAAHAAGIVHRDVKPSNVLFDESGAVKLADFGVASFGDSDLTSTGTQIGTPAYMAPEQLRGRQVDARADLYAVGATLFEAATGAKLHADDAHASDPEGAVFRATRDRALAQALARAVRERPDDRFPDAAAFADALRRARVRPRRAAWIAIALVAAAAGAIAVGAAGPFRARGGAAPEAKEPARVALLPFTDATGDAKLDFASTGLPRILASELRRAHGVRVIDEAQLRDRLPVSAPSADWIGAARALRADLVVRGELENVGDRVRVEVVALRPSGEELARVRRDVPPDGVPTAVRAAAPRIAALLGTRVPGEPDLDVAFAADRDAALGARALEANDFPTARSHLESAAARAPDLADAQYHLAILGWWQERPDDETLAHIERALPGLDEGRRGVLVGLRLFLEHRFAEATVHFERLIDEWPENRDALYGLSEALFHGGRPAAAMEVYRQVVALSPRFRLGFLHPLQYYIAHADEEGMRWAISRADVLDPFEAAVWKNRTVIARREYDTALRFLRGQLATADPEALETAWIVTDLVSTTALAGDLEEAVALAERNAERARWSWERALWPLHVARGDRERARRSRDAFVDGIAVRSPPERTFGWVLAAELDVLGGDVETARATSAGVEAAWTASRSAPLTAAMIRALLAGAAKDEAELDRARRSDFPEVAAVAAALTAERDARWEDASVAWRHAIAHSADGRFLVHEWYGLARARRAVGDARGVLAACDEVVRCRLFAWAWAHAVGPCLRFSAEAAASLGDDRLARSHWETLARLRARATEGDELAAVARAALAAPSR